MPMYEVDRMVAILRPTQLFVDWINSHVEVSDEKITLDILQEDCTALLMPPFENSLEAEDYIEERYLEIFENELEGWYIDNTLWPTNRPFALFMEWFSIEFHSLAFDLASSDFEAPEYAAGTLQ